jgi:Ca2+-binding EF-hand superfamily protein
MSFSQFTIASVNLSEKILTNHHLNLAFQLFDKDGLGVINAEGINSALGE